MKAKTAHRRRRLKSGAYLEPWSKVRARLLTNPEVRFHYDVLKIREQVGQAVAKARNEVGLTQAELATRAGTSQSAIARLEAGRGGVPSLDLLNRVATAVGLQLTVGFKPGRAA